MAHVKCRYDHYWCSMYENECTNCNYRRIDEDQCYYLECDPCYFEKTSKSIDFDGKCLIVSKDLFAYIGDDGANPEAEDNIIDYLEIDGILYYGTTEKADSI